MRIILADDHTLFRNGIRLLLETVPGYQVVAESDTAVGLEGLVTEYKPDLLIMDYSMPGGGSVAALSAIKSSEPDTKVIALTGVRSGTVFRQLQDSRADGVVLKDATGAELLDAIQRVIAGKTVLSASVQEHVVKEKPVLTAREFQILEMVVAGMSNKQLVERLGISIKTVETHRASISHKLGVGNVVELVHYARRHGLLEE